MKPTKESDIRDLKERKISETERCKSVHPVHPVHPVQSVQSVHPEEERIKRIKTKSDTKTEGKQLIPTKAKRPKIVKKEKKIAHAKKLTISNIDECDIIHLDEKIKQQFENDTKNLSVYKNRLEEIKTKLENKKDMKYRSILELEAEEKELIKTINSVEDPAVFGEYLYLSHSILNEYKEELNKPIVRKFSSASCRKSSIEKDNIIKRFVALAKDYISITTSPKKKAKKEKDELVDIEEICSCGSKDFEIEENSLKICIRCGEENKIISQQTEFKDIDRINITQKYKYGMKIHFKDTMNQFQGKQNKFISPKVHKDLEAEFDKYGITNKEGKTLHEKYAKVTKENIKMFLSYTGNNKHYEDITMLCYYYTGVPPPDISHLEDVLLHDFDEVEAGYAKISKESKRERLNFLNNQYILLQLLRRRKFKCNIDDFSILKTFDKQLEHDEIYEQICNAIDWQFRRVF